VIEFGGRNHEKDEIGFVVREDACTSLVASLRPERSSAGSRLAGCWRLELG
jgi:hypothetical protein